MGEQRYCPIDGIPVTAHGNRKYCSEKCFKRARALQDHERRAKPEYKKRKYQRQRERYAMDEAFREMERKRKRAQYEPRRVNKMTRPPARPLDPAARVEQRREYHRKWNARRGAIIAAALELIPELKELVK